MQVSLFTSVIPDRYCPSCIESWRNAGFHVVSVNHVSEAPAVRAFGIDVCEFNGDSRKPRISALMAAIRDRASSVAGIINSDCQMLSGVPAEMIAEKAPGSMIMSQRIDIDCNNLAIGIKSLGFDAFFFDTRQIDEIASRDFFSMGQPWWDYWLPVIAHKLGLTVVLASVPLLVHSEHTEQWDKDGWTKGASIFLSALNLEGSPPFHVSENERDLSTACYEWLCDRPRLHPFPSDVTAVVNGLLNRVDMLSNRIARYEDRIPMYEDRIAKISNRYETSLSWRITKPMRVLAKWARL